MTKPPPLITEDFGAMLGVRAQTVRVRLCRTGSYYGCVPVKSPSGRLLWPSDGPARILAGRANDAPEAA